MSIDIKTLDNGGLTDPSQAYKSRNLLTTQEGNLFYAPTFGINVDFFVTSDFQIQPEAFNSYVIQKLTENFIDLKDVTPSLGDSKFIYDYVVGKE